jgi:hypothetical protein
VCYPHPTVMRRIETLRTPPIPRIVPDGVFDAFGWCESVELVWGMPASVLRDSALDGGNPARMVFVMKGEAAAFLPRELARLHAFGMGFTDEEALAPYAIDDATDLLYAHRVPPRDALWLAADNLNALVWGLHDWAHFHNHGPFEERAWTELQCDAAALAWLWINRATVGVDDAQWERARREVEAIGRGRFEAEGKTYDAAALEADRVRGLVRARL